ncbi:MAG: hypothetical protein OEY86_03355 [Nitrospira sp.]|nr:hypothetical protein [Nitrospira sp.]
MLKVTRHNSTIALLLILAMNASCQITSKAQVSSSSSSSQITLGTDLPQAIEILSEASSLTRAVVVPEGESKKAKILQGWKDSALGSIAVAQARSGDISGALRTSRSGKRVIAKREIAIAQAKSGLPEDAMQTVAGVRMDYLCNKEILLALLKGGKRELAEQVASSNPILMGFLAEHQAKNGDSQFRDTFAAAIRKIVYGRHAQDLKYAIYPLLRVAHYQILAGDLSGSQSTHSQAMKILGEGSKYMYPETYVKAIATFARFEIVNASTEQRARIIQHLIDEASVLRSDLQIRLLIQFSRDLSKKGNTELAQRVLQQAMKVVDRLSRPVDQVRELTYVASFLGENGNKLDALDLLERAITIAESFDEPGLLNPMGRQLKGMGILATGTKGGELSRIVRISAELGFFDLALERARKLPDELGKAKVLATIAAELVKAKGKQNIGQHLNALSEAVDPLLPNSVSLSLIPHDDHVLKALATVETAVQNTQTAIHIANAVSRNMRPFAYLDMLDILANTDDIQSADLILREMSEEWLLANDAFRLRHFTRKQTSSGSYRQTLEFAHGQISPLVKANALVGIAEGLMDLNGVPQIPGSGQYDTDTF